jgi:hypothetical protein
MGPTIDLFSLRAYANHRSRVKLTQHCDPGHIQLKNHFDNVPLLCKFDV